MESAFLCSGGVPPLVILLVYNFGEIEKYQSRFDVSYYSFYFALSSREKAVCLTIPTLIF